MKVPASGSTPPNPKPTPAELKQQEAAELKKLQAQEAQVNAQYASLEKSDPSQKGQLGRMMDAFDSGISKDKAAVEQKYAKLLDPPKPPAQDPLPKSNNPFINQVAAGAVAGQQKYGVPASVTIAQAILESGWGKSTLATQAHNLFGIKGSGPAGSVTMPTQEYENGHYVTIDAQFAKYDNDAQSIEGHDQLLATSGYYTKAMADRNNPNQFAQDLTGVYATDPTYGQQLIQIMKDYNLYQYDSVKSTGGGTTGGTTGSSGATKTSSSSSVSEPTLSEGATGAAVAKMQQLLTKAGFSTQGVDGDFGPHTLAAVESFQRAKGLSVDGVCGPMTWGALLKATAAKPPPPTTGSGEPQVQIGSTGAAVTKLQQLLNKDGFNTYGVDGNFGPNTQSAVMAYQFSRGLSVDGVVGPATWHDLLTNAKPVKQPPPTGGSDSANKVAQRFLGDPESYLEFSGKLPMDTWAPTTEDCANFASACLQVAGKIPGSQQTASVPTLYRELVSDGWKVVPLSQAKPGDVCCFSTDGAVPPSQLDSNNLSHVELFNNWNGSTPNFIGSNNILPDGSQAISYDNGSYFLGNGGSVYVLQPPA
jgi:flagellum-specific peptidoglycan hydrolase FlgJ